MLNVGWQLTRRQLLSLRCLPAASFFLMCTLIIALCVYYWLQNKYVFIHSFIICKNRCVWVYLFYNQNQCQSKVFLHKKKRTDAVILYIAKRNILDGLKSIVYFKRLFSIKSEWISAEFTDFAITEVALAACDYQYLLRISNFHIGLNTTTKNFDRVLLNCAHRARKFDYLWWAKSHFGNANTIWSVTLFKTINKF